MKSKACSGRFRVLVAATLLAALPSGALRAEGPAVTREQLEADWLRQLELRFKPASGGPASVTVAEDAGGAVDGVKDGKWGFHTENEEQPWWQVDLQQSTALDRIVLYNRCDGGYAARASRILILLSDDARDFRQVYQHDGTDFLGHADGKPLSVPLDGAEARYVRLQLPGRSYFHLDEVEIYARGADDNVALNKSATQSSTSQWSSRHAPAQTATLEATAVVVESGLRLADDLQQRGVRVEEARRRLQETANRLADPPADLDEAQKRRWYFDACEAVREMSLRNPLLDFDQVLFVKRATTLFPHVSDQYYGWWSRPGGGLYLLKGVQRDDAVVRCLTEDWPAGSFLNPDISYDGRRVLFAWCRHYPELAAVADKTDKDQLPEDAFYHVFEMNLDDGSARQLTHGRYDDFDARYLPDGRIVFVSTRKGTALQANQASAQSTLQGTQPDSFVRCGGGNHRPVAVFTLHRMDADGGNLCAISAFENFEWLPAVASDGRILYARWDYIDRFNGDFFSLWSTNPDGTNGQLVYGNYTARPQAVFEARPIPDSTKLIFTATAHHSITG
ncbi:MAG: discoidin domain-containing protein, partial [Pirellulaceae bacterium]|nr:discoidin domain-containing protein [Pirellulaceae bacterium]